MSTSRNTRIYITAFLTAALCVTGCRNTDLPQTIPVRGIVSFNGQPCPGPGSIRFLPLEIAEGLPRRPGRADFAPDGRFEVTSFREADGLVPGTYRVQIECWKVEPAQGTPGESYIAAGYSPPDLIVDAKQSSVQADYNLPPAAGVE